MELLQGSSFVVAYAATGAFLGRVVDNVVDRLARTCGFNNPGILALGQLVGGLVAFGEVQRFAIGSVDSELGRTVGLYFFLSEQPHMRKNVCDFLAEFERALFGDAVVDRQDADKEVAKSVTPEESANRVSVLDATQERTLKHHLSAAAARNRYSE